MSTVEIDQTQLAFLDYSQREDILVPVDKIGDRPLHAPEEESSVVSESTRFSQQRARHLSTWYRSQARPFLEKYSPQRLPDFDRDCERLSRSSLGIEQELSVCFLGNSGVGKSTLINALVSGGSTVVPAGGVGPLTAQALTVRYGEVPRIEADYHGADRIWQLVFGLENSWKTELGAPKLEGDPNESRPGDFSEQEQLAFDPDDTDASDKRRQARLDSRKLAELLVAGREDRDVPLPYLLDSLRDCIGLVRRWGTLPNADDADRLARITVAIAIAKKGLTHIRQGDPIVLRQDMKDHASGFLAPLIKTLNVWWPSPLLSEGVTLIDLPGTGVVGDPRPEVTRKFMREKAKVVVLVVDSRGITEPVARLLRDSEFLARLLHTTDDPSDNPTLVLAVTRVDDIAYSESSEDESRSFFEFFHSVCERTIPLMRSQLRAEVHRVWMEDVELSVTKRTVIQDLLDSMEVYPLSAVQYQRLMNGHSAPLDRVEQTNVPLMIEGLRSMRLNQVRTLQRRLQQHIEKLLEGVTSSIRLVEAQWINEDRRLEEIEQLREDLESFIAPLRRQFDTLQGQYREFLRATVPNRITDLVKTAREQARNQIQRSLRRLGQQHWGTLRASVRRGGRFAGSTEIDVPREFALKFEEPIAEAWGKEILTDIRKRTNDYANGCLSLVEHVADWALMQGARIQPRVVEAQRDEIRGDANRLKTIGCEMIKEVRDKNATLLIEAIDGPIRTGCRKFVDSGRDRGAGVKNRILGLYSELADEVTEAAEKPALRILTGLFKEVEAEILDAFEGHRDPLQSITDAIVTSQQKYLERSDAQKRKRILDEASSVLSSMPQHHAEGATS